MLDPEDITLETPPVEPTNPEPNEPPEIPPEQQAAPPAEPEVPATPPAASAEQLEELTRQVDNLTKLTLETKAPPAPTATPEPKLTRDELDEMRDGNPAQYEQYLINAGKQAALDEIGDIDARINRVNQANSVQEMFDKDFPKYRTDAGFRGDVDYVVKTMGGNTPVNKIAAATFVEKYRKDENRGQGLAAAKIQGAKDEAARAANANLGVVPGTPKSAETPVAVDPYYAKYATSFGLDPQKLQERENATSKHVH